MGDERGSPPANQIGRTIHAREARVELLRLAQLVDQEQGLGACTADIDAKRRAVPANSLRAAGAQIQRTFAVASPRQKRAAPFRAENVSRRSTALAEQVLD